MKRLAAPILIGLVGAAILVALGVWQVQRLEWKQGILREIESTIGGDPIALPADPDPEAHLYAPVTLDGSIGPGEVHVLVSQKRQGAGYRVIAPFKTEDGRRVLVDRGFVPVTEKDAPRRIGETALRGNLHWPDDRNPSTPENDMGGNTWFARDIAALADTLDTDPVLVVARSETPAAPGIQPLPVSTAGIPNDHLQYAITWFSLAAIWIGMTVIWIRRDTFARQPEEPLR